MIITIQFKDKNKIFRGKTYDFLLDKDEEIPNQGDIIRILDENYNFLYYGTRTKVVGIKENNFSIRELKTIKYIKTDLD